MGQLALTIRRYDLVPGRDDHRGPYRDMADPMVRREPTDRLDGRDDGREPGSAQLSPSPPSGSRVVNVAKEDDADDTGVQPLYHRIPWHGGTEQRQRESGDVDRRCLVNAARGGAQHQTRQ